MFAPHAHDGRMVAQPASDTNLSAQLSMLIPGLAAGLTQYAPQMSQNPMLPLAQVAQTQLFQTFLELAQRNNAAVADVASPYTSLSPVTGNFPVQNGGQTGNATGGGLQQSEIADQRRWSYDVGDHAGPSTSRGTTHNGRSMSSPRRSVSGDARSSFSPFPSMQQTLVTHQKSRMGRQARNCTKDHL